MTARSPGTSHDRNDRSWSWANAFVGKTSSAVSRPAGDHGLDDRHLVAERLAGGGTGRDDRVTTGPEDVDRPGLMGPEPGDPTGPEPVGDLGVERGREGSGAAHPGRDLPTELDAADELRIGFERVERGLRGRRGHGAQCVCNIASSAKSAKSPAPSLVTASWVPEPLPTGITTFSTLAGSMESARRPKR